MAYLQRTQMYLWYKSQKEKKREKEKTHLKNVREFTDEWIKKGV